MQRYTDLRVWQRAHALALAIYRQTESFPETERFGLTTQLRRAVVSVPANIAEGSRRQGAQDYARFLNIAEGSIAETGYFVLLSRDLGYLEPTIAEQLSTEAEEIGRMLYGLRCKVEGRGA